VRYRSGLLAATLIATAGLSMLTGCFGMPPLAEQERKIRNNELTLRKLEPRAFVRAWGMPAYQHMEFMPFFGLKDGSMVPRSRLEVGAAPPGWEAAIDAGEALFLAYPDRGWLVVFMDEIFVYREELSAEKLHEIGSAWAHEDKFRTKIELEQRP
jgi:hypothetical protein